MSIDDSNESQSSEKVCARQVTKTPYFTHSRSSVEMAMFSSFNRRFQETKQSPQITVTKVKLAPRPTTPQSKDLWLVGWLVSLETGFICVTELAVLELAS